MKTTGRGREVFAAIAPRSEEIYAEIAATLGIRRIDTLYRALDEVIARLAAN